MYEIYKSTRPTKKFMVITPTGKKIHFGSSGYGDYTVFKDIERKKRYIIRHQKNENWNKSGINTAGFWSRWLLWNKPTLKSSMQNIMDKFNIDIAYYF